MKLRITVHGVAYEVEVEVLDPGEGFATPSGLPDPRTLPVGNSRPPAGALSTPPAGALSTQSASGPVAPAAGPAGAVNAPVAGTVVETKVKPGDSVNKGQELVIIEAMKMNTAIASPSAGTVKTVLVAAGDNVREGQALVELQ